MPDTGLVLAFDFGTRRIGVAMGETLLSHARPLATIDTPINNLRFTAIEKLLQQWQPARLIVGLPVFPDGTPHDMTARARRFAHQLEGRFRLPVDMVDERYTSCGLSSEDIDAQAAAVILQSWFDKT